MKNLRRKIWQTMVFALLVVGILGANTALNPSSQVLAETKTCEQCIDVDLYDQVPQALQESMKASIIKVYGAEKADEIYQNVLKIIANAKDRRPLSLHESDFNRDSEWYKDEIVYMFYAEHFGVDKKGNPNTFEDLIGMLDYLENLGVTTIYILPFMDSPMGDAGFDVRNLKKVREDLGGTDEFRKLVNEAEKRGLKVKADLILNHFSDQHKWFQQALEGDLSKLDYFVYEKEMPKYKKYRDEQKGIVVDYYEEDGSVSSRRLIFPDITDSHYRKVVIDGEDYYMYHTFYPFQLDINWKNPEVLYEVLDIMTYWSNMGVDIFRLDAIPYFIKKKGTPSENLPETHAIIELLSTYQQAVAPSTILLAEACQWPCDIVPYFGEENVLPPKKAVISLGDDEKANVTNGKELVRTDEVQVGYHFPYMPAIWASLLTADNNHFYKAVELTPEIPDSAAWAIFLRVHDELTLEMIDLDTRKLIYDKLEPKGKQFRKGLGVSGRMVNFLDKDPQRIGVAFSVLLSLPGIPIIYYGDEIGAENNPEYAEQAAIIREENQKKMNNNIEVVSFYDSRDINRGPVPKEAFYNAMEGKDSFKSQIFETVKTMIHARKDNYAMRRGEFGSVKSSQKEVLAYTRTSDKQNIIVINNLSDKTVSPSLKPEKIMPKKAMLKDVLTGKEIPVSLKKGKLSLTLQPYQTLWLEI